MIKFLEFNVFLMKLIDECHIQPHELERVHLRLDISRSNVVEVKDLRWSCLRSDSQCDNRIDLSIWKNN